MKVPSSRPKYKESLDLHFLGFRVNQVGLEFVVQGVQGLGPWG